MIRTVGGIFGVMVVFCLLVAAMMIIWGHRTFTAPGPLVKSVLVSIPHGASLRHVSEILDQAGVLENVEIFRFGVRYAGEERNLRSGDYRIPAASSMEEVLSMLVRGEVEQYQIAIPEGLTSHEVKRRIEAHGLLTGDIPAVPAEGRVAPDTHFYTRGDTRSEVLARMIRMQDAILTKAWKNRRAGLPLKNPQELLILASIVQREAGRGEHAKVASVFINRLKRGQRLQADATIRYGLTLGKTKIRRGLRQSELKKKTPYNTYQIFGLPPTPIANPGRAAIEGTANPADTDYLYFVADGTGGHAFSKTYKEHRKNVAAWRKIERARRRRRN